MAADIFGVFDYIGNVFEVMISPRRDKWGKRFIFARFTDVEDQRLLGVKLDNVMFYGRKIHVNLPRFERNIVSKVVVFSKGRFLGGENVKMDIHREGGAAVKRLLVGRNLLQRWFRACMMFFRLLLQMYLLILKKLLLTSGRILLSVR